jgi:putative DNA primase/helicase
MLSSGMIGAELFSEEGMAEYIASGLDRRLLFCGSLGGWLVYDESSGTFTSDNAEDVVYELIKIYRDKVLPLIGQADPQGQNTAFQFYKSMMGAGTKRAIISLMKHEPGVAALPADFNRDPDVVNCAGTVVSINGSARPARPEDKFTMSAACKPEPGIPENFMNFIRWSSSGNKELIEWKLISYGVGLFGHSTDKIVNGHGTGGNGKGTEQRTVYKISGSYATVLPRSLAIKEPGQSSRFDREALVGKRMAFLFDLKPEKGKLNLDDLKTLCGNGDPQSVEPKGKPRYTAVICCKIFIASNDKIPIDSFGESEKRRFYLFPYDNHIEEKDEGLEERFKPEYGKILNLFIEYAVKYFQNGRKMPPCAVIDRATADYFDSQDLVGQFIQDNCEIGTDFYMGKTELFNKFVAWCESEQAIKRPMKSKMFTEALEKRGIHETVKFVSSKAKRVFSGIITTLQKNLNFNLLSHENKNFHTNMNFENSCNVVMPKNALIPPEYQEYYETALAKARNKGMTPEDAEKDAKDFVEFVRSKTLTAVNI